MNNNKNGFASVEILILVLIVAVTGGVGFWVLKQRDMKANRDAASETAEVIKVEPDVADENNFTELSSEEVTQLQSTPSRSGSTQKNTTTQDTSSEASTPNPSVQEPDEPEGSITFSADGCYVTAVGKPGSKFEVGAYKPGMGGSLSFTLPAGGTLTKSSGGGQKGMTSFGKLSNGSVGYAEATIIAEGCPSAG